MPEKGITELDRLSYVVNTIESTCHLVPAGAFKLTPIHEMRRNEAFIAPSVIEEIGENFVHFRQV